MESPPSGDSIIPTTTDSAGGVVPTNPQLKQVPTESSSTNVSSDYASSATCYNIDDNSTGLKSLLVKNVESSNTDMKGLIQLSSVRFSSVCNCPFQQQEIQAEFVSNLFCNFPESEASAAVIDLDQMIQIFLSDSLGPNCCSADIQTILPQLEACGLITSQDQKYFLSARYTSVEKKQKLINLTLLSEKCTKKLIKFLLKTSDNALHGSLLKKIRNKIMLAKLEQAKAENKTLKVSYTTVLFCGSSGVGKTSLMKKLNKEQLTRHHHSTGVAKSKHTISIKTAAVVKSAEGLQWTDLDYDLLISQLNKYLRSLPKENKLENELADSSSEYNTLNNDSVIKENVVDVANDIAEADSSNTPSLGEVWNIINFLDTGGQPEFVNILPAVSGSVGLTFIVFDLSKKLNSFVHVQHNVEGHSSFEPYYLDCTNMEFIKRLMISSENFNKKITPSLKLKNIRREDNRNDSKICYVGTHALNVSKKEIKEIDGQLSSVSRELEMCQKLCWSSPKESLKQLFPIEMFPDEKVRESFEDIIEDIRDNIQKQVQTQDYYEVPITWFIFLLKLQKLCSVRKVSFISYQEAVGVWMDENNVNEDELRTKSDQDLHEDHHNNISRENSDVHNSLRFFHFIGMLFYYHEVKGICDFVFIDRQWLFEILTELVEIKFTKCYNKKDINVGDLENFTMQGRLSISIINNLKIDLQGIQPLHFINLLDHLNIIAPFDAMQKDYFMPCVLPSFPLTQSCQGLDMCYGTIQQVPLLVRSKNGQIPHGFFCLLIVELFKNLPTDWKLPYFATSKIQHVYNNLITFPTASAHTVSLFYKFGYLEIQVRHKESKTCGIHFNIRHELDKVLRKVSDNFQLNLRYGFYCECKDTQDTQHFAKLEESTLSTGYIHCDYGYTKMTEEHMVWLQEVRDSNDNSDNQRNMNTGKEPTMKWMHKIVIPKISYCWEKVADFLEYPMPKKKEIKERQRNDPYKCCAELMEDWINTDQGVKPKTWYMLVSVLKEDEELCATAISIEEHLVKEGLLYVATE